MDEKVKEIEERIKNEEEWIIECKEVKYLLSKIKELEITSKGLCEKIDWYCKRIKELEELTNDMGSDKALSEVLYEYHMRADKSEARVKELEEGIDEFIESTRGWYIPQLPNRHWDAINRLKKLVEKK